MFIMSHGVKYNSITYKEYLKNLDDSKQNLIEKKKYFLKKSLKSRFLAKNNIKF